MCNLKVWIKTITEANPRLSESGASGPWYDRLHHGTAAVECTTHQLARDKQRGPMPSGRFAGSKPGAYNK